MELPPDILANILLCLHASQALPQGRVCRPWATQLRSPQLCNTFLGRDLTAGPLRIPLCACPGECEHAADREPLPDPHTDPVEGLRAGVAFFWGIARPDRGHVAAKHGYEGVVRWLARTRGLDWWQPPPRTDNVLHTAAQFGHVRIAEVAIRLGANMGATNHYGATPLLTAAFYGQADFAEALLRGGLSDAGEWVKARMECRNGTFRQTALCVAASRGHLGVCEVLVRHGADLRAKDIDNWTPEMVARAKGHSEIVHFLRQEIANRA